MRIVLSIFIIVFCVGSAGANEEKKIPLFAAIQVSDSTIVPVAEFSGGKWKPVNITSDNASMLFEGLADTPWMLAPKDAKLSQVSINDIQSLKIQSWFHEGGNHQLKVSHFTQYGNYFEDEFIGQGLVGWGMVIKGMKGDSNPDGWKGFGKQLLFSKPVDSDSFIISESESLNEQVKNLIHPDMLMMELKVVNEGISRCKSNYYSNPSKYNPEQTERYCAGLKYKSNLIKKLTPKVILKVAKLRGEESVYFANLDKTYPLDYRPGCPDITAVQAWVHEFDKLNSILSKVVTMTDCDGKDGVMRIEPIGTVTFENRTFIFSQDFGYESRSYAIREYVDSKLLTVFGDIEGYDSW